MWYHLGLSHKGVLLSAARKLRDANPFDFQARGNGSGVCMTCPWLHCAGRLLGCARLAGFPRRPLQLLCAALSPPDHAAVLAGDCQALCPLLSASSIGM